MGIRAETTGFPCREFFRQRDEDYALAEAKTGPEGKDRHSEELRKAAIRSATSGLWNSLNVSDCGLITRTPSRLLLRTRREYFWNTGAAFAQHSCYQVRSRASFQPEATRSSTLRSSIVPCVPHCLRIGNEACTNCKRNQNSFADRRSFGDRNFRNRQRSSNTAHGRLFLIPPTQPACPPLAIAN